MTIEEKRKRLEELSENLCENFEFCGDCPLNEKVLEDCNFDTYSDYSIDVAYNNVFGSEEINHPDRYAGGKFECIDVMLDVFGDDAVKHFCILNAFKYIWRSEKKNGVEDIKKAVWYLNKYIELGVKKNDR